MGLLGDFIGGAAETGRQMLADQRQADLIAERDERRARLEEDLLQKRAATIEAVRADLARKHQDRMASEARVIDDEAPQQRQKRELATANVRAPSVDAEVLDFLKTTLPADKLKEAYGVAPATPVSELDDRIAVARQHGFSESENVLRTDRRGAAAEMARNRAEDDREKRTVLIEERNADQRDAAERRLDLLERGGGRAAQHEPSFVATYKFLEDRGYSREQIEKILTQKKATSAADLAAKLSGRGGKQRTIADNGKTAEPLHRTINPKAGAWMDEQGNIRNGDGTIFKKAELK